MKTGIVLTLFLAAGMISATCGNTKSANPASQDANATQLSKGDIANRGSDPTVRKPYEKQSDDPGTTVDESTIQPLGHMGTVTLRITYGDSDKSYPIDADTSKTDDGYELHRIYFVKGGWTDFHKCDLNESYYGVCTDKNGDKWEIEGKFTTAAPWDGDTP